MDTPGLNNAFLPTSALRWLVLTLLSSAVTTVSAVPPTPHHINASLIGTTTPRNINWLTEGQQNPVWCGSACSYVEVSTAKIAPDTMWTYKPTAWPGGGATTFPNPVPVERSIATPQGTQDSSGREIVYESPAYERAAVDFSRRKKSLTAKVYQSGNQGANLPGKAAAALAYHVQVQNQSSGARDYFIRFTAPKSLQGLGYAYTIGGPSGQQPMYISQKYAQSRSIVDVLVDGLPVWSTESTYHFPNGYTGGTDEGFRTNWGYASDNDVYTIFLGRFASSDTFYVDFVVRADATARAPQCGKVTEPATYPKPRVLMHCFLLAEGRALPAASSEAQRFEIYSKTVSTPVLQAIPGISNSLKDQ